MKLCKTILKYTRGIYAKYHYKSCYYLYKLIAQGQTRSIDSIETYGLWTFLLISTKPKACPIAFGKYKKSNALPLRYAEKEQLASLVPNLWETATSIWLALNPILKLWKSYVENGSAFFYWLTNWILTQNCIMVRDKTELEGGCTNKTKFPCHLDFWEISIRKTPEVAVVPIDWP